MEEQSPQNKKDDDADADQEEEEEEKRKMTTDISVSVRWDPATQQEVIDDYDYDGGNSSSRLFERSRIKALAGI